MFVKQIRRLLALSLAAVLLLSHERHHRPCLTAGQGRGESGKGAGVHLARTIPIIAMTDNAFAEDVRDALEAGMNAHAAKPVDMAVLEQTVGEVLKV